MEKFARYRRCATLEVYMLVHQDEPLIEVYRKEHGWKQECFGEGQTIGLEQLDLELSLAAIYEGIF
jgi:Uma2 family endonuclease